MPYIIFGMICAESTVINDIANKHVSKFRLIQFDSIIRRFFNNKLFNGYAFYNALIRHIIKHYKKKHNDNRVHIIVDHMFSRNNYTTLMMSMRVGKQGIPIWFRCFKGRKVTEAFEEELIVEGINYIIELFKDTNL